MTVEFVTVATDELVKEGKIPRVFQEVEGDRPAVVSGRIKVHHSGSNQNAPPWTAVF